MRATLLLVLLAGCKPTASVEQTLPVANLQAMRTVGLTVRATAFAAQGQAMMLEQAVTQKLQRQCGFTAVGRPGSGPPADVLLDLNITSATRGASGWGGQLAKVETLLVVSDGQSGELLGTARIRGESSGAMLQNKAPESEAIEVVSKTVADVLAKSGCSGPRIARAEPPPEQTGQNPPQTGSAGSATEPGQTQPDESKKAEAEAINEDGKVKLRSADIPGALAAFQQASSLYPDARFQYNVCLALEAQERWADAIAACQKAKTMNPQPSTAAKIDKRLALLQQKK